MIKRILNHQSRTVTFAAGILAAASLINGLLALFRDRLLASRFGAGETLDIYFAAFRIPDFIYGILIAGGIISVFLPVFSQYYQKEKEKAWEFANVVLNCFLVLLIFLCSLLMVFTPFLINLVTPGFSEDAKSLTVSLTRIMLLSPFFFVLSSIFSGILHYFNRFLVYALSPILYTSGIIIGILFFVPLWGIWGLALGVILGAFFHLAVQIPSAISAGFRYRPIFNFKFPGLWKIFRLMIPRTVGAAANHFNLIVITAIASTLVSGSIAVFNLSNNLHKFPIGLIGVSFASAAFPALSRTYSNGQKREFLDRLFTTTRQVLFLIIPISLLVLLLRAQLVRLILGTGQFGWWDTQLTAASLGLFSFGIFAHCMVPLLTRAFYSFQDTKTPVIVAISSITANIILSFTFVWLLGFVNPFQSLIRHTFDLASINNIQVVGLPLAFSLSGILNLSFLFILLSKRIKKLNADAVHLLREEERKTSYSLIKILVASFFMTGIGYFVLQVVSGFVNMQTFVGIFVQTVFSAAAAVLVYLLVTYIFGSPELRNMKSSFLEQFKKPIS